MQHEKALGMIETYGEIGAIEALDAALKAANSQIVDLVFVGGGYVTVLFEGDVAAVKASVDAGAAAAEKVGQLISVHVIPKPDSDVGKLLKKSESEPIIATRVTGKTDEIPETVFGNKNIRTMTVAQLRTLARSVKGFPLTKQQINVAKKKELLSSFENYSEE